MYCVTAARNDDYWAAVSDQQGSPYDSCIEITNFYEFSKRVSMALTGQGISNRYGTKECFFEENSGIVGKTFKQPDYFRKSEVHKTQQEIRTVFLPSTSKSLLPKTLWIDMRELVIHL